MMLQLVRQVHLNVINRRLSMQRTLNSNANWAKLRRKKWATDHALENFDEYYKPVFGERWPSVRLALLSKQKYCAVVNNFSDSIRVESALEQIGASNVRHDLTFDEADSFLSRDAGSLRSAKEVETVTERESNEMESSRLDEDDRLRFSSIRTQRGSIFKEFMPATKLKGLDDYVNEADYVSTFKPSSNVAYETIVDRPVPLPHEWKIYSFGRGDVTTFPSPRRSSVGVLDYYLMDVTSLLPVLALNVQDGDNVLDMCAAPGGKSLAVLQTMKSVNLICNDESQSRMRRLRGVLNSYVPSDDGAFGRVTVTTADGRKYESQAGIFNKILVDVPCTTDRHAVTVNDNNIYHPIRMKERVRLPEKQTQLLSAALKAVKPGGTVVYSTCSLSPIQNDGVVHMALSHLWETTKSNFVLHDLYRVFHPFRSLFEFHRSLKYGQLVLPVLPQNFGPMYICKLSKID